VSDTIKNGIVVGLEYVLRLDGGEEVDRSEANDPLEYLHGHKNIIPGLESQLGGLKEGDSKEVKVNPAEAYGEYDEESVGEYPRGDFPPDLTLTVGTMLEMRDPDGATAVAIVKGVGDDAVTLDFNHPLAGETLNFSVKVVSLREATQEELSHGHAHGAHGHH
jgi:FKBP-type peptidyl-prolyl cis-trans isomerase SlyD